MQAVEQVICRTAQRRRSITLLERPSVALDRGCAELAPPRAPQSPRQTKKADGPRHASALDPLAGADLSG